MHRLTVDWGAVEFTWRGNKETVRMNHDDCPAGQDTRQRLYITRTIDNTFLAYCHNCGGKAWRRAATTKHIYAEPEEFASGEPVITGNKLDKMRHALGSAFRLSSFITKEYIDMYVPGTNRAMDKLYVNSIELKHVEAQGWVLGTDFQGNECLAFPCDETGYKWQVWRFDYKDPDSKRVVSVGGAPEPYIYNPNDSPLLVIVEDRLSGIKIAQAGFSSLCLHGLRGLDSADYHALTMMYDTFVVWLDNDVLPAKEAATNIHSTLKMFSDAVHMVDNCTDPKYYHEDEINSIIKRVTSA